MPDIVLTTLNARYAHASFALRYLMANLSASLRERAAMLEFGITQRPVDVLEAILAKDPKVVGIGVYIWNAEESARLVADLKRVRPDVLVILGGPEVSYETDQQQIVADADYVITGEGDIAFSELCEKLLIRRERPLMKLIPAELPEFDRIALPYDLYTDHDLAHRVVYVEASRGCPFKCEFCLSSLDVPVRNVALDAFLGAMQRLLDRGLRRFKFVDRTFNLNLNFSRSILQFFLDRYTPGLFLHFEMIPDRLPEALREPIARFPAGALQFEVGVQTFNEQVAARISRKQDNAKLAENLRFLREQTGVHVHAGPDRRPAGRRRRQLRRGIRSTGRLGASGDPGRHAQAPARNADRPARCGLRDGLQPAPALRDPSDPRHRLRDDAATEAVCAVLGPDRQQRELRRVHAAHLVRRSIGIRDLPGLERLAVRDGGAEAWDRPA